MQKVFSLLNKRWFVVFLLFFSMNTVFCRTSKIAIVNLVKTELVHRHFGTSSTPLKTETFDCQLNSKQYMNEKLSSLLSSKYGVDFVTLPDSCLSERGTIYNGMGIRKDFKKWVLSLSYQYDFVLVVESNPLTDLQTNQLFQSGGLYTMSNSIKSEVMVFSNITFTGFKTAKVKLLDYSKEKMNNVLPVSDYKFGTVKSEILPEMLPKIKAYLEQLMDYKINYFLKNSELLP